MLQIGLLLALACAFTTNIALLCKHRGALAAPSVQLGHPLASAASLFRSRWWTIGFAVAIGAGALLLLSGTTGSVRRTSGPLLGAAAGLLLGVANVAIKALTGTVGADPWSLAGPWTLVALLAGVGAFFALARGLQIGGAIPVITFSSVTANLASITGGIIVFGDSVGGTPLDMAARCGAFAAVIAAAVLMPTPIRAAEARA